MEPLADEGIVLQLFVAEVGDSQFSKSLKRM